MRGVAEEAASHYFLVPRELEMLLPQQILVFQKALQRDPAHLVYSSSREMRDSTAQKSIQYLKRRWMLGLVALIQTLAVFVMPQVVSTGFRYQISMWTEMGTRGTPTYLHLVSGAVKQ